MPRCLIGLGSNLGNRRSNLESAIEQFAALPNVKVQSVSTWFGTEPIGGPSGQGGFLNGAAVLETTLAPQVLLEQLRGIESSLGRERRIRWDARTIDVDILLYDDLLLVSDSLTIPHPRMICRRFVLEPAVEVAADWTHPVNGWSIRRLFTHLGTAPPLFLLCGFRHKTLEEVVPDIAKRSASQLLASDSLSTDVDCSADPVGIALESLTNESTAGKPANLVYQIDSAESIRKLNQSFFPKLLIVPVGIGTAENCDTAVRLRDQLTQLDVAPVLTIASSNAKTVADETVAAIEAMK